jgi:hypothetical protein
MLARRVIAVPVLVVGGLIWTATLLATIVVGLYYLYAGGKQVVQGDVVAGLLTATIPPAIATFVLSILMIPGSALMALGQLLWGDSSPERR